MHPPPAISLEKKIEQELGTDYHVDILPCVSPLDALFPEGLRPLCLEQPGSEHFLPEKKRQFALDITPRPVMGAGAMVDLLVRTNVGHYIDFRALDGLYVEFGNPHGLQRVPGSRSDVFQNQFISMLEKRLLMRFVKKCGEGENPSAGNIEQQVGHLQISDYVNESSTFIEEMSAMELTNKLQEFLMHSIAFGTGKESSLSKAEGVEMVQTYQQSMMRYGTKTPFLYPNYGCGELPQAFCRLCAVNGGVYVLRRGLSSIVSRKKAEQALDTEANESFPKDRGFMGVITTEQELVKCKHVFISKSLAAPRSREIIGEDPADHVLRTWKLIAILDGSVTRDAHMKRIMVTVPRGRTGNKTSAVRIRQLDEAVMTCPSGFFVLYAETLEIEGSEEDLLAACRHYTRLEGGNLESNDNGSSSFEPDDNGGSEKYDQSQRHNLEKKPRVLWGVVFSRVMDSAPATRGGAMLVSRSDNGHDSRSAIAEARRCFEEVHPEGEFFAMESVDVKPDANGQYVSKDQTSEAEQLVQ